MTPSPQHGAGNCGDSSRSCLDELNFNPVIRFTDDGGRHLRSPSNPLTRDMSVIAVFRTGQTDGGVFWNAPALIGAETSGATADWALGLSSGQVHMKAQAGNGFGARSGSNSADALPHIAIGARALGGTTTLYIDGGNTASEVSDNVLLTAPQGVGTGNHNDPSTGGQFAGDIAEAIIYDRTLTDAERERVESYLAIKYGLTLDQTTPRNYVDSAGNVIFDTSLAGAHINDIAGIGLDNISMLNQPRSRSGNSESLVEISNASDQQNGEFLVWGNDGGAIDATTPVVVGDRTLRRSIVCGSSTRQEISVESTSQSAAQKFPRWQPSPPARATGYSLQTIPSSPTRRSSTSAATSLARSPCPR